MAAPEHICDIGWLPAKSLYVGELDAYVDRLHAAFVVEFVTNTVHFLGRPVRIERRLDASTKRLERFHHLSTEIPDGKTRQEDRIVDVYRCERLCWIAPMLAECPSDRVRIWCEKTRRETSYSVALIDFSYVVHLDDRGDYFHLATAFPVERARRREKLEDQWKQFRYSPKPRASASPASRSATQPIIDTKRFPKACESDAVASSADAEKAEAANLAADGSGTPSTRGR